MPLGSPQIYLGRFAIRDDNRPHHWLLQIDYDTYYVLYLLALQTWWDILFGPR